VREQQLHVRYMALARGAVQGAAQDRAPIGGGCVGIQAVMQEDFQAGGLVDGERLLIGGIGSGV
jgi:hypothetical protein